MAGEIILMRKDLKHLEQISSLILDCEKSPDISSTYNELGRLLLDNLELLDIDEDIMNISRFAVGLAIEISPLLMTRATQKARHWEWRPVVDKQAGAHNPMHDVRSKEKQIAGMIDILIFQLKNDPAFRQSALALAEYQHKHKLWTEDDEPGIEI